MTDAIPAEKPDRTERVLAGCTLALLAAAAAAIGRGRWQWAQVPVTVWAHLGTAMLALALTPAILLCRRGTTLHRILGWLWAGAMMTTAAASLFVRVLRHGQLSPIHLLSVLVLLNVPLLVSNARRGNVAEHRRMVRRIVLGGLVIAGAFTLIPGRILGGWLLTGVAR